MVRNVTVAATQKKCTSNLEENLATAEKFVREAAAKGANIILLQELFESLYFCQDQKGEFIQWAKPADVRQPALARFSKLAAELNVVLPISFYEQEGRAHYNSIGIIDADGSLLGIYRKSHIPDGPGYQEKFYFNPGDTGFRVWDTKFGRIGVGICWDQWFPETARCMALLGAEIFFFPTAIGSEPQDSSLDSRDHWQRVMQGHAGANVTPLVASNRTGTEKNVKGTEQITFYGSSFIADPTGAKVKEASRTEETVLVHTFDLDAVRLQRDSWGIFRDRRPELYRPFLTLDGERLSPSLQNFTSINTTTQSTKPVFTVQDVLEADKADKK